MASLSDPSRLAALAEAARRKRLQWVDEGWEAGPRHVSKADVTAFLRECAWEMTEWSRPCCMHAHARDLTHTLEHVHTGGRDGAHTHRGTRVRPEDGPCASDPETKAEVEAAGQVEARGARAGMHGCLAQGEAVVAHWPVHSLASAEDVIDRLTRAGVDALLSPRLSCACESMRVCEHMPGAYAAMGVRSGVTSNSLGAAAMGPLSPSTAANTAEEQFRANMRRPEASDIADLVRSFIRDLGEVQDIRRAYAAMPDPDEDYDTDPLTDAIHRLTSAGSAMDRAVPAAELERADSNRNTDSKHGADELLAPPAQVLTFFSALEAALRRHPLWRNVPPDAWDAVLDAAEKLVMGKLWNAMFAAPRKADERDKLLTVRFNALQQTSFRHFDLPEQPPWLCVGWRLACEAFRRLDEYCSPNDKMQCIMNACQIISVCITLGAEAGGDANVTIGADDFLPALIYVILHSRCPRLYSNLRYLGDFTRQSKLNSETGYFFTNVLSGVHFLRTARPQQLHLDDETLSAWVQTALAKAATIAPAPELIFQKQTAPGGEPTDASAPVHANPDDGGATQSTMPVADDAAEAAIAAATAWLRGVDALMCSETISAPDANFTLDERPRSTSVGNLSMPNVQDSLAACRAGMRVGLDALAVLISDA